MLVKFLLMLRWLFVPRDTTQQQDDGDDFDPRDPDPGFRSVYKQDGDVFFKIPYGDVTEDGIEVDEVMVSAGAICAKCESRFMYEDQFFPVPDAMGDNGDVVCVMVCGSCHEEVGPWPSKT